MCLSTSDTHSMKFVTSPFLLTKGSRWMIFFSDTATVASTEKHCAIKLLELWSSSLFTVFPGTSACHLFVLHSLSVQTMFFSKFFCVHTAKVAVFFSLKQKKNKNNFGSSAIARHLTAAKFQGNLDIKTRLKSTANSSVSPATKWTGVRIAIRQNDGRPSKFSIKGWQIVLSTRSIDNTQFDSYTRLSHNTIRNIRN